MQPGTRYQLEVNPKLPKRLVRLEELAGNLWYSWDRATRAIFARLNPALWDAVGHNPKAMLKRIDEQRLIDAASDPAFLDSLTRVLAAFDAYHAEPPFQSGSGGFKPPFVGVGLLYRQGYFVQTIDAEGRQRAEYSDSEFTDLPIEPVQKDGRDLTVELAFPGR